MISEQPNPGLKTRSAACSECGRPFTPARDWSRFCSDSCRAEHWRRGQGKQNPPSVAAEAAGVMELPENLRTAESSKPPKKWRRVLAAFVSGQTFNRFQAERELNDHCLHSTVSGLQRQGVRILRTTETVPGYQGAPTRVCRYQLDPASMERAQQLLKGSDGA